MMGPKQHSPEYLAYRRLLARKRMLWIALFAGMPFILILTAFFSDGAGPLIGFPSMLLFVLGWKFFFDQNDVCPWCGKSFSARWTSEESAESSAADPQCANCGKP